MKRSSLLLLIIWNSLLGRAADLKFLNDNRPVRDSHNCYPYDGQWTNRVDRALSTGFPVAIEQDLAWFLDPATGKGRVVVDHSAKANAADPDERQYFFERVRPIIEKELSNGDTSKWPVIVLHFDFKDNQDPLLHALWDLLGDYEPWITTAIKTANPQELTKFDRKPILVLTEDSDAQERVFFDAVPVGSRLRLFGSAHTHIPATQNKTEWNHLAATLTPEQLLTDKPTNYRRWWNNSWYEVEEGGQPNAGAWTKDDAARLKALVDHAHKLGYWIRFYTLDGFAHEAGKQNGWFESYNFGTLEAVEQRWQAAIEAGVNLIATDQYEELAAFMQKNAPH
ncbi:MAG TPA: hypothetical protein VFA65_02550 [Bryobacteraceae bacterium]|nr:hypothetical protein [Bryobacteraceae bacterium]